MATSLLNRAQISYTFNGSEGSAVSNQTRTRLLDRFTMEVTKDTLTPELRAGNNAAYVVRVENTGAGELRNIRAFDNLGEEAGETFAPLTYVEGSAVFYLNGNEVQGTAETNPDGVVFETNADLDPGDNLLIFYLAQLDAAQTEPVTNTVTVTARTGASTASVGNTITECDSATVTPVTFAQVSIFKEADMATVVSGDTLTYTFTLMNTGFEAVDEITFTDEFPEEFNVTSVAYTINGVRTPVDPADYTISGDNTLRLPAAGSDLTIGVPAATQAGPGITVITVTGTIE